MTKNKKLQSALQNRKEDVEADLVNLIHTVRCFADNAEHDLKTFQQNGDADYVRYAVNEIMGISMNLGLSGLMRDYAAYVVAQKQYLESMDADEQ